MAFLITYTDFQRHGLILIETLACSEVLANLASIRKYGGTGDMTNDFVLLAALDRATFKLSIA